MANRGVPPLYNHHWKYALDCFEVKNLDGTWTMRMHGQKTNQKNPKHTYYKVGKDSRFKWLVEGYYECSKVSPNIYNMTWNLRKKYQTGRILHSSQARLK